MRLFAFFYTDILQRTSRRIFKKNATKNWRFYDFSAYRRPFESSAYRRPSEYLLPTIFQFCFPTDVLSRFPPTDDFSRFPPTDDLQQTSRRLLKKNAKKIDVFPRFLDISAYRRLLEFSAYRRPPHDVFLKNCKKNRRLSDIFRYFRLPTTFPNFHLPTTFRQPPDVFF